MNRPLGEAFAFPMDLGEPLEFMRLVWALDHVLQTTSKRMKAAIGVTGPQRLLIRIVARFPGITAFQISRLMCVHPSTVTGILKRLERSGLVRRRPDPRDRRRVCLGVTEKGQRINAMTTRTIEAVFEGVMRRTAPDKLEHSRQLLVDLAEALQRSSA